MLLSKGGTLTPDMVVFPQKNLINKKKKMGSKKKGANNFFWQSLTLSFLLLVNTFLLFVSI